MPEEWIEVTAKTVRIPFAGNQSIEIGGRSFLVIAGPCSIESEAHLRETAQGVKNAGAAVLRGGIFKMRTNPTSFQGMGSSAFSFLKEIKSELKMPLVSEITDPRQISDMMDLVDMFQVGSRNMYNYALLKELGQVNKPVLLKRGFSATADEWINAAEYIYKGGNEGVVLCERGIRTFETTTRNTLDLNTVAYLKAHTSFPVIVDPSHGTGRPELIGPMSLAAAAVGADGIIIEVHPRPKEALSDGHQALTFAQFDDVIHGVRAVVAAVGKHLHATLQ